MGYLGARGRGTLIYEKNLKSKILCQTPFKKHVNEFFTCTPLKNSCVAENSKGKL